MYRSPAEKPRARLPLLDRVTIKTPCRESWDAMTGDDRVRFCARCSKDVYDLSAMTEDEAEAFLATHLDDQDACVRLYRRPDGRVLTSECVQGARTRHTRRAVVAVAAGLCATVAGTVAMANVHLPNGRNLPRPRARVEVNRHAPSEPVVDVSKDFGMANPGAWGDAVAEVRGDVMGGMVIASKDDTRPTIKELTVFANHGYPVDVVRRIVRMNHGRFRLCYEDALKTKPDLTGSVTVRFVIQSDGSVAAIDPYSNVADPSAVACIGRSFTRMAFPSPPNGGLVSVSYGLWLKPPP